MDLKRRSNLERFFHEFGTPEKSKTLKPIRSFSQLGEFVPGIPLHSRSRLKVRDSFGVFALFECQLIWDVLYHHQILCFNYLRLYHNAPDSGERQCNPRS